MTDENQPLDETDKSTLDEKRDSEETSEDVERLFDEESQEDAPVTREEYNRLLKGVKKLASQKGREKPTEQLKEEKPSTSNDDVTELFLESKPNAEFVKDELKTIADKLYNGSIIKAWKEETWLHDKAQSLSEANKAKTKVQTPSNQIEGEINFKTITPEGIAGLSDKDYGRYKEYLRKQSPSTGIILS